MAQTAAHLVDRVLPEVPWRQWVLTLPFPLRYRVAYDPGIQNLILRTFLRTLSVWQCRRAKQAGISNPRWGAVTIIQRFGSALQLTPHFHTLGMDGVFAIDTRENRARFHPLEAPTDGDVEQLVSQVGGRVIRALVRRGLLSLSNQGWADPDELALQEPAVAACYGAAVQGRLAFGDRSGQLLPRIGRRPGARFVEAGGHLRSCWRGFNLHAGVCIEASDRHGLEHLCRYIARPALANDRLRRLSDGRISLELKRPFSDGSTHVIFTPQALIERLCALIPRPRTHRVRYHGLLAPASPHRHLVVPETELESHRCHDGTESHSSPTRTGFRWVLWAELLRRVFDIDALNCPNCHGRMRVIAAIMKADVIAAILECLGLDTEALPLRPARAPPNQELVELDWR